jgi:phosphatidylglycerophosphate synthase
VPAWIVVIIIAREFLVTGLRLLAATRGNIIPAGKWGKHKTVWQIVVIVALLLGMAVRHDLLRHADPKFLANYDFAFSYIAQGMALGVAVITVASGVLYFIQHRELIAGGRP